MSRLALAICTCALLTFLVPIGLATLAFGALLGAAGGLGTPSATGIAGQVRTSGSVPIIGVAPVPEGAGPNQSVAITAHGLVAGWADRGPLNQYARSSYGSDNSWLTWKNADCSAAALYWLLGAYGQPLGSLDEAIALIGPGTGISTRLGLLDARGPALARAAARGIRPREPRGAEGQLRPLASIAEVEAWLDQGPLLMDGARWFGEGHWSSGSATTAAASTSATRAAGTTATSAGRGCMVRSASVAGSSAWLPEQSAEEFEGATPANSGWPRPEEVLPRSGRPSDPRS